jgi:acyl-coenzyme A thioesterase PaaI-like protein
MLRRFPIYPGCPVCGDPAINPATLGLRWCWDPGRATVVGSFTPAEQHSGFAGRLHGGILSSLLDECMAWACAVERRRYCITGELQVRFKVPARLGEPIEVVANAGSGWGPYLRATAAARSPRGELIATASATFAALSRQESIVLRDALRFEPGDWDLLESDDEAMTASTAPARPLP